MSPQSSRTSKIFWCIKKALLAIHIMMAVWIINDIFVGMQLFWGGEEVEATVTAISGGEYTSYNVRFLTDNSQYHSAWIVDPWNFHTIEDSIIVQWVPKKERTIRPQGFFFQLICSVLLVLLYLYLGRAHIRKWVFVK